MKPAGTVEWLRRRDRSPPGDFVILKMARGCGQCRACKRGRPQYCFDTFNAAQKMTLTRRHRVDRRRSGSGASPTRHWCMPAQAPKSTRGDLPWQAAGCGVRRPGCGDKQGAVNREAPRGDGAVASATPRIAGASGRREKTDHRRRHRQHQTGLGPQVRRHPHHQTLASLDVVKTVQDLTGGFGAQRGHRRRRAAGNWEQAFMPVGIAGTVVLVGVPDRTCASTCRLSTSFAWRRT